MLIDDVVVLRVFGGGFFLGKELGLDRVFWGFFD